MTVVGGGRQPVVFRCRLCPPSRIFLRVADARGRLEELRRAARALYRAAAPDHATLFGHVVDWIEVVGGGEGDNAELR